MLLKIANREINLDQEGYLINPEDWDEDVAREFARQEQIDLTANHWIVIYFMRRFFEERQIVADVRHVTQYLLKKILRMLKNYYLSFFLMDMYNKLAKLLV